MADGLNLAQGPVMWMPEGQTNVTLPTEQLCHYITDDELERVAEMRKEPVMEIFLCTFSAFLGAAIPSMQVLSQFSKDATKVNGLDLLIVMVAAMMLAVAGVSGVLWKMRAKSHKTMVDTIRGRDRIRVRLAHDNT